jgi:hypothetical protein
VGSHLVNLDGRWSGSGGAMVYFTARPGPHQLWIRAHGENDRVIARVDVRGLYARASASISPDSRRIAYSDGKQVWIVPAAGGQSVPVFIGAASVSAGTWTRDGESLLVSDGSRLLRVPADGSPPSVLRAGRFRVAMGSPDGRWVWYENVSGSYLLAMETGSEQQLSSRAHDCDFTADSRHVVCLEPNESGKYELITRDVSNGRETRKATLFVERPLVVYGLSLHPDGTRFLTNVGSMPYDIWMAQGFAQPTVGWMRWFRRWNIPAAFDSDVRQ